MAKASRCKVGDASTSGDSDFTLAFSQEKNGDIYLELEQTITLGTSRIIIKLDEEVPDYRMLILKKWLNKVIKD